jgi:hypothetical protein
MLDARQEVWMRAFFEYKDESEAYKCADEILAEFDKRFPAKISGETTASDMSEFFSREQIMSVYKAMEEMLSDFDRRYPAKEKQEKTEEPCTRMFDDKVHCPHFNNGWCLSLLGCTWRTEPAPAVSSEEVKKQVKPFIHPIFKNGTPTGAITNITPMMCPKCGGGEFNFKFYTSFYTCVKCGEEIRI